MRTERRKSGSLRTGKRCYVRSYPKRNAERAATALSSAEKFIALVDKYQNFDELTTYMLNEFVEKIVVHERDRKGSIETSVEAA